MVTTDEEAKRSEPPDIFASKITTIPAAIDSHAINATITLLILGYYFVRWHS